MRGQEKEQVREQRWGREGDENSINMRQRKQKNVKEIKSKSDYRGNKNKGTEDKEIRTRGKSGE